MEKITHRKVGYYHSAHVEDASLGIGSYMEAKRTGDSPIEVVIDLKFTISPEKWSDFSLIREKVNSFFTAVEIEL